MLSHRINNLTILNMCGGSVTPAVVLAALLKSGLCWEMHYAQVFALESLMFDFTKTAVLETEVPEEMSKELFKHKTDVTLMGLPVKIDNERYPKHLIRLMLDGKELSRIEGLGIPGGFMDESDFTEEGTQREREKFAKLTYGKMETD